MINLSEKQHRIFHIIPLLSLTHHNTFMPCNAHFIYIIEHDKITNDTAI